MNDHSFYLSCLFFIFSSDISLFYVFSRHQIDISFFFQYGWLIREGMDRGWGFTEYGELTNREKNGQKIKKKDNNGVLKKKE